MLNESETTAPSCSPKTLSGRPAGSSAEKRIQILLLFGIFALALFLRAYHLGANGLSEDEANKIMATVSYRHGDFAPNAEHPMLMKSLGTMALIFSEKWNRFFPDFMISPEGALRFPVAFAGAATVFAVFLLGKELLNAASGLLASLLWAVDINAVALSRIAKEDAMVVLFFILANYFLLRGKRLHFADKARAVGSYIRCGACFGLLFASKYLVPLPWITLTYYDLFRFRKEPRWRIDRPTVFKLFGVFFLVFLLVNPIVLSPQVWNYIWKQFMQKHMTHHGYLMMDRIWLNGAVYTFWGIPVYFYALYLAVKTPLLILFFFFVGIIYTVRRYRDDRFLFLGLYFLLWIVMLSLPGGKFTRYAITLLPAVVLLEALGLYIVYSSTRAFLEKRGNKFSTAIMILLILMTAGWQLNLNRIYHPMQSLYVSLQAGGESRWGYYFPQDDFYDAGLRETIQAVCEKAPPGSSVVGTTPSAFGYYQRRFGRPDLRFVSLPASEAEFEPKSDYFFIAQDYRQYFENEDVLTFLRSELNPLFISRIKGRVSVELYFLSRAAPHARSKFWTSRRWPDLIGSITKRASDKAL